MKNIKLLLLAIITITSLNSCVDEVEAPQTPFATFERNAIDLGVEQGGQTSMDIKIYTANTTNQDRTVEITIVNDETTADAAAYTVTPSISIPAGSNVGILTVGLQDIGLTDDKVLTLRLTQTEDLLTGDDLIMSLSQLCPNNGSKVKIDLEFDNWPEEAAWRILDSNGSSVVQSATPFAFGAYASNPDGSSTSEKFCLDPGTYTIEVYDGFGDGGTVYTVSANGITLYALAGNAYTSFASGSFVIP